MVENSPNSSLNQSLPIYTRFWHQLKQFPKSLHQGSSNPPATSGSAAAFLISAGIGAVTMMVAHHLGDSSKTYESALEVLGSWMPGSTNINSMWGSIGPFAGKQTMMLIGWLLSLGILYPVLKNQQVKPRTLFFWMFSLFTLATVMSWHPFFPYLPLQ